IAIPEAENGVNADEIAGGIQTQITLPTGTLDGDSITLTVIPAGGGTPIQITHVVTDTEATAGLSEVTIPNDLNGITADGDYSIVAIVIDKAGNSSAPSTAFDITVDTVALLTVDKPIAGDDIVNAVEAVEGFNVTGTGTAGDKITLTNGSGDPIGTVKVGDNGKWSIAVTQEDVNNMDLGLETLKITANDLAGNVSSETADITIVPADKLTITSPIAGDNMVNAEEADTGFNVTGTGTVGDTITLTNQAGATIGTAKVGLDNRWSINVDSAQVAAMGEGAETLTATSTVSSDFTSAMITIDTVAPDKNTTEIIVDNITADNIINAIEAEGNIAITGTVSRDYSEGDAVTIKVNGIDYAGAVDFAGKFSVEVPGTELVADSDKTIEVSVVATDKAGNTGIVNTTKNYNVNTDEIIAAADNFVDFQLDATPLEIVNETPSDLNKTGFTVVGASLGPVLGAGVAADVVKNSVVLEVGEDQVREVTVKGNAGGIQVAGTMDLSLYKLNESTNEWELQEVKENWVVSYLLGGVSKDTDFSLDEGQWLFVMSGGEGISALTGYTLEFEKDVVLDYSEATAISGSVTGNILADDDSSFSYDELPSGTTVTSITSPDGIQEVESSNTIVQGQYGTLTISPDGSYEYSVNEDFRGPYGSEESFTYTITSPDGNTASAELNIQLNILPADKQIKIDESLVVDIEPTVILDTTNSEIKDAVGFGVLDLSFGSSSVLDLELLGGKPPLEFTVGDNQVRELTVHGSAGGVELAKTYSMAVYKLDEDTGQYVQVHFEKNWFNAPFLGGKSNPLTLQFGEGDYKAVLLTAGGVGVLSGNGLYVDRDIIYDYDQPSEFMGEITGDATPDADTVILKVGEEHITSDATMTVQGQYGQLTIDANGNYTYSVSSNATEPAWKPPYGEVDSFRLVTQDADGKAAVETLNIKIGTHTAVDDFNALKVSEQNLETSDKIINGVSAATKNISRDFTVAEDTLTSATLKVDTTTIGTRLEYSIIDKDTGEVVSTNKGNVSRSLDVTIDNLAPGNYTIEIKRVAGLGHLRINGSEFTTKSFHLDEYMASDIAPVEGLLLENDAGIGNIAELKVGSKSVFISDPNQGAKSIDIEGLYGTLTVNKDGSYSYVPNGKEFGVENFTYETISVTGVKETATLEINVGKNIAASIYDDTAISSAADDSFTMGARADTVIFTNLGGSEGGSGNNGLDTWTDFDAAQGDKIDISGLLDGNQTASIINNYLAYENGVLMVDRNGNSEFEALLEVTATDLDTLLGSIEWQADTAGISTFSIGAIGEDTISLVDSSFDSPLVGLDEAFVDFDLAQEAQNISLSDLLEPEVIDISGSGITTLAAEASDGTADLQSSDWAGKEHISMDGSEQAHNAWQIDSSLSSQFYIDTDMAHVI
ncbi:BapA/Bap/LapF family large adhesin, partial [Psychrobacter sp.]|uniref:BapA/Bap/LapF family large adhesin n=1 Tax=Psychrobacter sp. TaxID=56811 RepID=UPI002FDA1BE2